MVIKVSLFLLCLAFWLQGLFFGWETYVYSVLLGIFILFFNQKHNTLLLPRKSVYMFVSLLLILAGYVLQVILHPSNSGVIVIMQILVVLVILLSSQLTIQSVQLVQKWQRTFVLNVILLLLVGWMIKGEGLLVSVFTYANALAALCMMAIFWIYYEWKCCENKQHRYYLIILLLFVSLSLLATGARIAWCLTAFGLLAQSILYADQNKRRHVLLWWGGAVGFSILVAVGLSWYDSSIRSELTQVSSLRIRLTYYLDALRMIGDHPLLGVGADGWAKLQYQYQTALYSVQHVHNQLLQIWLDAGILSVIGWIALLILLLFDIPCICKVTIHREDKALVAMWISSVVVFAYSFLDFILSFPALMMSILFYWVSRCLILPDVSTTLKVHRNVLYGLSVVFITVGLLGGYREVQVIRADMALAQGHLHTVLQMEEQASIFMPVQSRNIVFGKAYMEKAKRTQRKADWERAYDYLQKGIAIDSEDYRLYSLLIYTSHQLNQKEMAVQYARKLIQLQPGIMNSYELYAKSLFQAGRYQEVLEIPRLMTAYKQEVFEKALFKQHIFNLKPSDELNKIMQEANRKLANSS